jgi:hypothetical protein
MVRRSGSRRVAVGEGLCRSQETARAPSGRAGGQMPDRSARLRSPHLSRHSRCLRSCARRHRVVLRGRAGGGWPVHARPEVGGAPRPRGAPPDRSVRAGRSRDRRAAMAIPARESQDTRCAEGGRRRGDRLLDCRCPSYARRRRTRVRLAPPSHALRPQGRESVA